MMLSRFAFSVATIVVFLTMYCTANADKLVRPNQSEIKTACKVLNFEIITAIEHKDESNVIVLLHTYSSFCKRVTLPKEYGKNIEWAQSWAANVKPKCFDAITVFPVTKQDSKLGGGWENREIDEWLKTHETVAVRPQMLKQFKDINDRLKQWYRLQRLPPNTELGNN